MKSFLNFTALLMAFALGTSAHASYFSTDCSNPSGTLKYEYFRGVSQPH